MSAVSDSNLNAIMVEALDRMKLNVFVRNHPFLDDLDLSKEGGSGYRIPVFTGAGGGKSNSFTNALANAASNGFTATGFSVTSAVQYGITKIQWVDQAYSDAPQSPVDVATTSTENAGLAATENLVNMLLGDSSGIAGAEATISSNTNPTGNIYTLHLTVMTDAAKFAQGDVIVSKANAAASLDSGTASVVGVNQVNGDITVDGGGTWTPTNAHVIGLQGQLQSGASLGNLFAPTSLWVPPVSARTSGIPTTTSFQGVTRDYTSNVAFVSGFAYDGSNQTIVQAIQNASAIQYAVSKESASNVAYLNPTALAKAAQEIQTQVRYDLKSNKADVYYGRITVMGAGGPIDLVSEPSQPMTAVLMSKRGTWEFAKPKNGDILMPATNGKMIIDNFSGNESRAAVMATGYFGCNNLAAQCNLTISNPSAF